jgi:hypothetical protein
MESASVPSAEGLSQAGQEVSMCISRRYPLDQDTYLAIAAVETTRIEGEQGWRPTFNDLSTALDDLLLEAASAQDTD